MSLPASSRDSWRVAALASAVLTLVLTWAARDVVFGPPILELGDLAVNALQIEHAKSGRELYGNYSRFQFNHPGPAFFYMYAFGERLLFDLLGWVRSPYQAHLLTGIALQSGFFVGALVLLRARLGAGLALPLAGFVAALHYGGTGNVFTTLWPPYVLAMPFLCFLTACASAASGRPRHGLVALVCGGFLVHGHVAQPLLVAGLGLPTLVVIWLHHRRGGGAVVGWRRAESVAAAVIIVLFALPLVTDLVRHGLVGNTATIVRRFITNTGDAKSALQAVLYVASFATPTHDQAALLRDVGPETWRYFASQWYWLAGGLMMLVGLAAFFGRRWSQLPAEQQGFLATASVGWVASMVLCGLWALAQAGPMEHFNGAFFVSVYAFPLLVGAAGLGAAYHGRGPRVLGALFVAAALAFGAHRLGLGAINADVQGVPVRRAVEQALARSGVERPKILLFDAEQWPVAAAVALHLRRSGVNWYTMERWNFMFQPRHGLDQLGATPWADADVWHVDATGDGAGFPAQTVTISRIPEPVVPDETVIDHATNFDRFALAGLEVTKPQPVFTVASRALLLLAPAPATGDVRLVLDAAANSGDPGTAPLAQPAEIWFNGVHCGDVRVSGRAEVDVRVPRDLWHAQPVAVLELRFPEAVPDHSFTRPRARDAYAWTLWSLRFESVTRSE